VSPLLHRAQTAAFAAATTLLLASDAALAAAADGDKKVAPPQADYGESTPLSLPSDEAPRQLEAAGSSSGGSLVRTFVGLAVVVAVIYGLYWILKQVKASREERSSGSGLSSQAVVPLGPNRSLHLVRAGRELVLLGVAEQGVTPIRRYTEAEAQQIGLIGADDDLTSAGTAGTATGTVAVARPGAMTIGDALERLRKLTVRA
jgi:flagellar protein FliO/FliZ